MSIFYHNDDPLLYNGKQFSQFVQENPRNGENDPFVQAYRQQLLNEIGQKSGQSEDFLSILDNEMTNLDDDARNRLNENERFVELSQNLQNSIQKEIMNFIRPRINMNKDLICNIKEEIDIINKVKSDIKAEERSNFNEMNDYMKNYSHLTFDEYKKIKYSSSTDSETTNKKGKKR